MTQFVSVNNRVGFNALFHRAAQLMSVLVFSVGLVVAAFSREIMMLWTGNPTTAEHTYILVTLSIVGSIFLALQVVPYSLALAHGWVRLSLTIGIITVVTIIPLMVLLVNHYGAIGGCVSWILINAGTTPFFIHFLHRRLLPGEERQWYLNDVGRPFVAACIVVLIGRWLISPKLPPLLTIASIICLSVMALIAATIAAPAVKNIALQTLKRKFNLA
jgi:O-antigen/teichoic acid export membrane protein